ncbi:MAG: 5-oxoprolinase subunit C family protein [Gammaproteobacteria bacterium]
MRGTRLRVPHAVMVEAARGLVTIQDGGRWGFQRLGVSVGGAMDARAAMLANILAGNKRGAALLEVGWDATLALSFPDGAGLVLTGVDLEAILGTTRLPLWSPQRLAPGSQIRCRVTGGRFGYLACSGGFLVPPVLGGQGTDLRSGWGGFAGRMLGPGDRLPLGEEGSERSHRPRSLAPGLRPPYRTDPTLRILPGSHWASFPEHMREIFLTHPYAVTAVSDRMGYRLSGMPVAPDPALQVDSEPVTFGSIQIPPDGQPIVLMADRPTVGGYPRLGEVLASDLPLLAQLRPGDPVRFEVVDHAVARRSQMVFEAALQRLEIALRG